MKTYDLLVMGELNVDLILSKIQAFPKIGTEIIAQDMILTLGSSSAICACNASALGCKVAFLGKIGNDYFGTFIRDSLRSKNVGTDHLIRSSDYQTGATVALSYGNERAMVTHPGAMAYLSADDLSIELLQKAKHLHVSSVFLQPLVQRDLIKIFTIAKEQGLTTSLDPQWDPTEQWQLDLERLLPLVDVFMPNEDEVLAITKKSTVEEAIASLQDIAQTLVVKLGQRGSLAVRNRQIFKAGPFLNMEIVDAIGAGDSFDAGFLSRFIRSNDIEKCLRLGNLAGAINTTAAGGTTAFSSPERIRQTAQQKFHTNILEL